MLSFAVRLISEEYMACSSHGIITMAIIYFLPAWFIAVKGHSPVHAGIDGFPTAFLIAPFAIVGPMLSSYFLSTGSLIRDHACSLLVFQFALRNFIFLKISLAGF